MNLQTYFIEFSYLLASILFILGLKGLSHPETAKRGMHLAEFGMMMAIIGTLMHFEIVSFTWIIVGLLIGSTLGAVMGVWVPMTAMPQRTALSHAFGAFAAALVGIAEYYAYTHGFKPLVELGHLKMSAMGFEIMLGSLTTTGSLIAFAKLQGLVPGKPLVYRGQNIFNMLLLATTIGLFIYLIFVPTAVVPFYLMLGFAFLFGILLVLPIGSADMPVVMSLLNSYAGLASAATGFVLSNNVLIIAGTLDGFSGFILSILMCRAMNRSMANVLFGAFGGQELFLPGKLKEYHSGRRVRYILPLIKIRVLCHEGIQFFRADALAKLYRPGIHRFGAHRLAVGKLRAQRLIGIAAYGGAAARIKPLVGWQAQVGAAEDRGRQPAQRHHRPAITGNVEIRGGRQLSHQEGDIAGAEGVGGGEGGGGAQARDRIAQRIGNAAAVIGDRHGRGDQFIKL